MELVNRCNRERNNDVTSEEMITTVYSEYYANTPMFERSSYTGTWVTRASKEELKSSSYRDFDLSQFPSKKWILIRISIDEILYGKNETKQSLVPLLASIRHTLLHFKDSLRSIDDPAIIKLHALNIISPNTYFHYRVSSFFAPKQSKCIFKTSIIASHVG